MPKDNELTTHYTTIENVIEVAHLPRKRTAKPVHHVVGKDLEVSSIRGMVASVRIA